MTASRIALMANPGAGGGATAEALGAALEAHGSAIERVPLGDEAALAAAARACDRVVVAGGDGSIGPAARAAVEAGVELAVVPSGTANDFARGLGLPADRDEAVRLAATGTRIRRVDLGRLAWARLGPGERAEGELPFVNGAGTGLAVAAGRRATALKPSLGPLAYAVGAAGAGLRERPVPCQVEVDGVELFAGSAWQVVVTASGHFGAGSSVEEADADDGIFDVAVLPAGSRLRLPRRAWGLKTGRISSQPGVRHGRGRTVALSGPAGIALNLDGELLDAVDRAEFTLELRAVALVVP